MAFISMDKPSVGDPIKASWASDATDNMNDLDSRARLVEGSKLSNGSFEVPVLTAASSVDPTGWSVVNTGSASDSHTFAEADHGKQSWSATVTTGGDSSVITSTTYIPVRAGQRIAAELQAKATDADVSMTLELLWWYWNGSAYTAASTASTTLRTVTAVGTSWTTYGGHTAAPAGANPATFYTVQITTDYNASLSTVYYDGVKAEEYSGSVPMASSTKATGLGAAGTYTYNIASDVATGEVARSVQVLLQATYTAAVSTYTIQGWVGGAWSSLATIQSPTERFGMEVPLDPSMQFRIVVTNPGGSDVVNVYAAGTYTV